MIQLSIDLGTSHTRAAISLQDGVHEVRLARSGETEIPTAAYIEDGGRILIGEDAVARLRRNGADEHRYFAGLGWKPRLATPPPQGAGWAELVAAVLGAVKRKAQDEYNNGAAIESVVLTIPALCIEGDPSWKVMEEAARLAGFTGVRLVSEPDAAAAWFDWNLRQTGRHVEAGDITLVYDLGGGTFDPALLKSTAGGYQLLAAQSGERGIRCGGMYFDAELRRDFARRYSAAHAHATRETANERDRALQLRAAISLDEFLVRNVKHSFSETDREEVLEAEPVLNEEDYQLSRTAFEEMLTPLVDRTVASCDELLDRAGIEWAQLKRIVMVGGSCRLPLVRARLAKRVGAAPVEILWRRVGDRDMKPEVAVVCGAALGPQRDAAPGAQISGHLSRLVPQRVLSGTLGSGLRRLGDGLVGMEWESGLALISADDGSVLWRLPNIRLKHLMESADPARLFTARFTADLRTGELGPAPSRDVIASTKHAQESRAEAWSRFCEEKGSLQVLCASPSDRFRLFGQADGQLGIATWNGVWTAPPLPLKATFHRFCPVSAFRDESALFLFSGKSMQWLEYSIAKRVFVDQGQLSGKFAGSGTPKLCALNGQLALRVGSELVLAKLPSGPWRSFPFSEQELSCPQDIVAANGTLFISFSTSAGYSVTHWRLLTVNSTTTPIPSIENVDDPLSDDEGPRLRQLQSAPSRCREYWSHGGRAGLGCRIAAARFDLEVIGEIRTTLIGEDADHHWRIVRPNSRLLRSRLMARLLEGIQFSPDCSLSPNGKLLLARPSSLMKLIRIDDGAELLSIASPFEERAFWSPDSSRFALAGWFDIRVFLTGIASPLFEIADCGYIKSCAFSPDSEHLAVATERAVHLYHAKEGTLISTLPLGLDEPEQVIFGPSRNTLVLRLLDGRIRFHYWPDNTSVYLLRIGDANIFYTEDGFFVAPPAVHPYIRVHTPERLQTADKFHRPDLLTPILKKIWEE